MQRRIQIQDAQISYSRLQGLQYVLGAKIISHRSLSDNKAVPASATKTG